MKTLNEQINRMKALSGIITEDFGQEQQMPAAGKGAEIKSSLEQMGLKGVILTQNENNPQDHLKQGEVDFVVFESNMATGKQTSVYLFPNNRQIADQLKQKYGGDLANVNQGRAIVLYNIK